MYPQQYQLHYFYTRWRPAGGRPVHSLNSLFKLNKAFLFISYVNSIFIHAIEWNLWIKNCEDWGGLTSEMLAWRDCTVHHFISINVTLNNFFSRVCDNAPRLDHHIDPGAASRSRPESHGSRRHSDLKRKRSSSPSVRVHRSTRSLSPLRHRRSVTRSASPHASENYRKDPNVSSSDSSPAETDCRPTKQSRRTVLKPQKTSAKRSVRSVISNPVATQASSTEEATPKQSKREVRLKSLWQ